VTPDICVHGDLHTRNIIIQKEQKKIVFVDAICRKATPYTIWLDILLFSFSIAFRADRYRLKYLQEKLFSDIILNKENFDKKLLLLRQELVTGKFFLHLKGSLRGKLRLFIALVIVVKNVLLLFLSGGRN